MNSLQKRILSFAVAVFVMLSGFGLIHKPVGVMAALLSGEIDFSLKSVSNDCISENASYTTDICYGIASGSLKLTVPSDGAKIRSNALDFEKHSIMTDWSGVSRFIIPVYSHSAIEKQLNIVFTKTVGTLSDGYYVHRLKVNWTGWKQIELLPSQFEAGRGISDWSVIKSVYFNMGDWGAPSTAINDSVCIAGVFAKSYVVDFSDSDVSSLCIKNNVSYTTERAYADTNGSLKITIPSDGASVSTGAVSFSANGILTDWTGIGVITLPIYSSSNSGQNLNIIFTKSDNGALNGEYYVRRLPLNWSGWRLVEIRPTDFLPAGTISDWSKIGAVYFNMGGWSAPATKKGIEVCISTLTGIDYSGLALKNTSGSAILYAGSEDAYKKGTKLTFENAPEIKNSMIYAPLENLAELLGMECGSASLSDSGIEVSFTEGMAEAKVGMYTRKLKGTPYISGSVMYVTAEDVCDIFEIDYHIEDGCMVMNSAEDIEKLNEYENAGLNVLYEAISKNLSSPSGSGGGSDDCRKVVDNWVKAIAGDEENDVLDPVICERVESVVLAAQSARAKLIKQNDSAELFSDITSTASSHMTKTSQYIYQMALAYGTYSPDNEYYLDEELLEDILYCFEWFYENRYGADEAANNAFAWRDRTLYNWWDWSIGTPNNMIPAMMIVCNKNPGVLASSDIEKYLACFDACVPTVSSTGANYIEICKLILGASVLKNDAQRAYNTVKLAMEAFEYVDDGRYTENAIYGNRAPAKGQGFFKDGSYIFHTLHAMNGVYGLAHIDAASSLADILEGTSFALPGYCTDVLAKWLLNSFDSLIYLGRMPRMVLGREDNPAETDISHTVVKSILRCFESFGGESAVKLGSVVRAYAGKSGYNDEDFSDSYAKSVEFSDVPLLRSITNDDYYSDYEYSNSTVFGNMDKVMHKRQDWAVGISMSSSRIFNYESINGANKKGWYLGDGRTELILKNEGKASQASYWQNIDYYRLPGTTVDTQTRKAVSIGQGNEYLSSKDFVGGAELCGKYTTAAMHLESYHNDVDYGADKGDYGGKAPAHQSDLTAKKSYFMFDDEIFCLGADVNASANNGAEVLTIVENRLSDVSKLTSSRGTFSPGTSSTKLTSATWLNHGDELGYYFPNGYSDSNLYCRKSNGYFEMWFSHGVNPSGGTYAYAILPGMTSADTKAYAASPEVTVLSNTASVQAVRHTGLDITSIVFWQAGEFEGIEVSSPMIVMVKNDGKKITLAASDPTHKLTEAEITLKGKRLAIESGSERVSVSGNASGGDTTLKFNFKESNGASYEANLTGSELMINSVEFHKESAGGERLNHYNAHTLTGKKIYAQVRLLNLTEACDESVRVFYAMYASDGSLQDVVIKSPGAVEPGADITVSEMCLVPDADTAMLKVYVWNGSGLKPAGALFANY